MDEDDDDRIQCEDCLEWFYPHQINKLLCECWICEECEPDHGSYQESRLDVD